MNDDGAGRALSDGVRKLLRRWFVEFNPLYFFSALSVLCGVHLVSSDLQQSGRLDERLLLSGVLQAYEILLIAGCAILFRLPKGRRPAVILAILEMAFLFDPTLQLEALATVGHGSPLIATTWYAFTAAKLIALARALDLADAGRMLATTLVRALGVVCFLTALGSHVGDPSRILLGAAWFGAAILACEFWLPSTVDCDVPLDDWGQTVLRRVVRIAPIGWTCVFVYHMAQSARLFDAHLTSAHVAPFLLALPFAIRRENVVWIAATIALWMGWSHPESAASTAVVVAAVLAWFGWRTGPRRLLTGAVLATFVAGWTLGWSGGPLAPPEPWLVGQTALVLLALGVVHNVASASFTGGAIVLASLGKLALTFGRFGMGALLLALGFASLAVGIASTWYVSRPPKIDPPDLFDGARWEGGRSLFSGPMFLAALLASIVVAAVVPLLSAAK